MSRLFATVFAAVLALLFQSPAWAQTSSTPTSANESRGRDDARFSARAALGFTADPGTFLMSLEVPWHLDALFSAGPLLQLGVSDDDLYFAPTVQVYVHPRLDGDLEPFRPYAHAGIGLAYLDKDNRGPGGDDDDVDFQFTTGLGIEYELREDLFMGTGLLFNVVPGSVVGEQFIFSWQILAFRHSF